MKFNRSVFAAVGLMFIIGAATHYIWMETWRLKFGDYSRYRDTSRQSLGLSCSWHFQLIQVPEIIAIGESKILTLKTKSFQDMPDPRRAEILGIEILGHDTICIGKIQIEGPAFEIAPKEWIVETKIGEALEFDFILMAKEKGMHSLLVHATGSRSEHIALPVVNAWGLTVRQAHMAQAITAIFGFILTLPWLGPLFGHVYTRKRRA